MNNPQAHVCGFSLPERLRSRREFLQIQNQGRKFRGRSLTLMVGKVVPPPGATAHVGTRMGYTVSRRVGNAVVRNRVRRHLKEMVRLQTQGLAQNLDHVLVAHPQAATCSTSQLRSDLNELLQRARSWAR